jgi:hypothetical protein
MVVRKERVGAFWTEDSQTQLIVVGFVSGYD